MNKELTQAQKYDILQYTLWHYVEKHVGLSIVSGPGGQVLTFGGHDITLGQARAIWHKLLNMRAVANKEGR